MLIYKYTPHNQCCKYNIVRHCELWFAEIKSLNDPLDLNLAFRQKYSIDEIREYWERESHKNPKLDLENNLKKYGNNENFVKRQKKIFEQIKSRIGVLCMSKTSEIWEYLSQITNNINKNHALINFAINGNLEKFKYFLEQGANINATSSCGCTSLMLASKYRYLDILKYLVDNGADMNIRDRYGKTALNYSRADEVREFLIRNGARE